MQYIVSLCRQLNSISSHQTNRYNLPNMTILYLVSLFHVSLANNLFGDVLDENGVEERCPAPRNYKRGEKRRRRRRSERHGPAVLPSACTTELSSLY